MKLIVGLGNPGREYAKTRHNTGFRVLDILARRLSASFDRTKFKGEYAEAPRAAAEGLSDDGRLMLVKPLTFMNLSGEPVQSFVGYFKVELPDLLVVVDDVALPLGTLRIRGGGSAGGHNGLRDIALRLGTQEYARLRVGVGGREEGGERRPELRNHVLGRFSAGEEKVLEKSLELAAEACVYWAQHGLAQAMNRYNATGRSSSEDPGATPASERK